MARGSPVPRVAWGLVVLTSALLFTLDLTGLVPRAETPWVKGRLELAEGVARQAAAAAHTNDMRRLATEFEVAIRRDESLRSVGLRSAEGRLLIGTREHRRLWDDDAATDEQQIRVPIHRDGEAWAELELRFDEPPVSSWLAGVWQMPIVRLVVALAVLGFLTYALYLRRILRHLDPSAVVPPRVRAALDVMAEGVVLIDEQGQIALANQAFSNQLGQSPSQLLGRKIDDLDWHIPVGSTAREAFPWRAVLADASTVTGVNLQLVSKTAGERSYNVNAAPVLDGWGKAKGAIVTFNDVSELEARNRELRQVIMELEKSRTEIQSQAEELELQAKRDSLTGVSNRRAFMSYAEEHRERSADEAAPLACLMVDIDHFKRINDSHGHATGDAVIKNVAESLAATVRSTDTVCRYGGEEFCVLLPSATPEEAVMAAERMRKNFATPGFAQVPVTASFGVAILSGPMQTLAELIDEADQALYASKRRGRNRVTLFGEHEDPPSDDVDEANGTNQVDQDGETAA